MKLRVITYFIEVITLLVTAGCGSVQIPLNTAEEQKVSALSRTLKASVWIQYDSDAVRKRQPTGMLSIGIEQTNMPLENTLCQSDSAGLRKAQFVVGELLPLLRFRENHDSVEVYLRAVQYKKSTGNISEFEHTECSKAFVARLKPGKLQFRNTYRASDKPDWYW